MADHVEVAALYAAPTRFDQVGRVLAAVTINGTGPYRFVVDTGANRSAISARVAQLLNLQGDPESMIEVHGVTGFARVPSLSGAQLQVGEMTLVHRQLPVLEETVFADADGILGVDGLQDSRIEVDFVNDTVTVRPSTGRSAPPGYLVVPGKFNNGGLLLVRGKIGRVRAHVIIDTGAQRSMGNLALHRALYRAASVNRQVETTVFGATPGSVSAIAFAAPVISIGDAYLRDVIVTFADLHVFTLWGLADVPALVLGMDVLGTVDRFAVDYKRREFQFRPPAPDPLKRRFRR